MPRGGTVGWRDFCSRIGQNGRGAKPGPLSPPPVTGNFGLSSVPPFPFAISSIFLLFLSSSYSFFSSTFSSSSRHTNSLIHTHTLASSHSFIVSPLSHRAGPLLLLSYKKYYTSFQPFLLGQTVLQTPFLVRPCLVCKKKGIFLTFILYFPQIFFFLKKDGPIWHTKKIIVTFPKLLSFFYTISLWNKENPKAK